jgi:hypothetical protein
VTAIHTDKHKIRIRLVFNNPALEFEKMYIIREMQRRHVNSHTHTHTHTHTHKYIYIYIFIYLFIYI